MAGEPAPPKTEADLLIGLPASNRPGVFPRNLLSPGERVLYETRPNFVGLYLGRTIVIVLFLLLWLAVSIELVTNPAGWFFVAVFLLLIVYFVLAWQRTAYALTDLRVVRVSGLRRSDFLDASYDQVQNLALRPGLSGGIRFDATPPNAPGGMLTGRKYAKTVNWRALPEPPAVYGFVQRAFALHDHQASQVRLRASLIARLHEDTLPCPYCGGLVDIKTVDYAAPKCPRCGAPLVEPAG
jgi:hypothetical protein